MGKSDRQEQTSTVNTTTTTNIRDIGLSGAAAVDLADVLQSGAIESEAIRATSLDRIVQSVGTSYQQLIGGANNLIETGSENIEAGYQQVTNSGNLVQNTAQEATNTIRQLADRATNEDSDFIKVAPYIAVVVVGLLSLTLRSK